MAAVLGMEEQMVEAYLTGEIDGSLFLRLQLPWTISDFRVCGCSEKRCEALKEAGAKRALILPVGWSIYSPYGTRKS